MHRGTTRRTDALEQDARLRRWKLLAGMLSLAAMTGLFATSLTRAPNDVWTLVTGVIVVALAGLIGHGVWRHRRRSRRWNR
jgi:hypothetical protein